MPQTYQRFFALSIMIHIVVLIVLVTQLNFAGHMAGASQPVVANSQPIKAVAVNSAQVAAQVAKLKAEQQAKEQAELKRQQQLNQQAAAAKRQREIEQQRIANLKTEAIRLQQQQAAQAKAEAQKLAQLKAQQVAEQKRLVEIAKQQEANQKAQRQKQSAEQQKATEEDKLLQQQLASEQQQLEQDRLQAQQAALAKYGDMIRNAIQQQWIVPENMAKDITCKLSIQLGPGGVVLAVKLVQSSGNAILDRSAMAAVRKASPLPVPADEGLFNELREINLLVRPEGFAGG
jgi:colicin import membrane protein